MIDVLVRVLLLVAIFGSVFLISQVALGSAWRNRSRVVAVNQRLAMIRAGAGRSEVMARLRKHAPDRFADLPPFVAARLQALQRMLLAADVPYGAGQIAMVAVLVWLVLTALIAALARNAGFFLEPGVLMLIFVMAGLIAVGVPLIVISGMAQRRRRRMEQQFPIALDVFVRALRAGHPIASALDLLTREMEDPIGSEFGLVADEVSYGAELTDALEAMANRWNLEDMRMFVVSLAVQSETGGNLAEILDNLAQVIRARASLFMKVRALSSEGRMTGWMLSVLPVFAFVSMFLVNPGFYLDVARDPIFVIGFPSLLILYTIGVLMIRHMIDLKV